MSEIRWGHSRLELTLTYGPDEPLRLTSISDKHAVALALPPGPALVEVLTAAQGRQRSSSRLVYTQVGCDLRYVDHATSCDGDSLFLRVFLEDPHSQLGVQLILRSDEGVSSLRAQTVVTDLSGHGGQLLLAVPSWSSGIGIPTDDATLLSGTSDWLAEGRWNTELLRGRLLVDLALDQHGQNARGSHSETSTGTWSTAKRLPIAGIASSQAEWSARGSEQNVEPAAMFWQIEHNGPWRWEVGEDIAGLYLSLSGPTDIDHQWSQLLSPGESFESVPISIAIGPTMADAVAEMGEFRRRSRRQHDDNDRAPVIFNDYMNTIMGDPTTEKLLPLITAASTVGAEIFCIDAGWYDDGGDWWDSVGEWKPSSVRFSNGLGEVIDRIHDEGMVAGLWLEPEVVGVRSPLARSLPEDAFFHRGGKRVLEHGRYHLDFSSETARRHLDQVVDGLVADFGIGYFKLDYNIDPGAGTDIAGLSVGAGLLRHNRAYLGWVDALLDRHPELVLENCSSGAMRMDPAMMSRFQLQSTSDQQSYLLYPPIAASAPLSILPEQAANWSYPQPEMSLEQVAFCLCTGMLGRFFLSGHLGKMGDDRLRLVTEAIAAHKLLRLEIRTSSPRWPLGLPGWSDGWLALALKARSAEQLVTVWKRTTEPSQVTLNFPELIGHAVEVEPIFPTTLRQWSFVWNRPKGQLSVQVDADEVSARTFRIRPSQL